MIAGVHLPWALQWALCFISGRATETHQLLVSHDLMHTYTQYSLGLSDTENGILVL